jgi:hypothetical protein
LPRKFAVFGLPELTATGETTVTSGTVEAKAKNEDKELKKKMQARKNEYFIFCITYSAALEAFLPEQVFRSTG